MNLGDVNVKRFGKKGDYLIKVEQKNSVQLSILWSSHDAIAQSNQPIQINHQ